jgi:hypothetical protein
MNIKMNKTMATDYQRYGFFFSKHKNLVCWWNLIILSKKT